MNYPNLFDKQETEGGRAYEAFCAYRDMGVSRSLLKAWRLQSGNEAATTVPGKWNEWSARYEWKRRAEAWDSEQARRRQEEAAETYRLELEAYRVETILRARKAARVANELLDAATAKLADPQLVKDMAPRDAALFIRVAGTVLELATRIEGIALGILSETGELLIVEK